MSMNSTPIGERLHIGIFGKRNVGKSSLINAITNQNISIVSDTKGTTTDPVSKSMELLPLGPVVIIDTPGIDDVGSLGEMRIKKAYQILNKTDIAILVIDASTGLTEEDKDIIKKFQIKNIPYIIAINKCDLYSYDATHEYCIHVSAKNGKNIDKLKEMISRIKLENKENVSLIPDIIQPLDNVLLVVPIDSSAPKGRLILPQQQTIRNLLDIGAITVVVKDTELDDALKNISPKIVITDSQVFNTVRKKVPENILLTSFSILFARYKGELKTVVEGITMLDKLSDGNTVLICEGCTHHRQCNDIGSVKLPKWISEYTGKDINFEFSNGIEFPENITKYSLIIHCGACMLNNREMQYRLKYSKDCGIPISNYGISIAYMNGILKRSLQPFPEIYNLIEKE